MPKKDRVVIYYRDGKEEGEYAAGPATLAEALRSFAAAFPLLGPRNLMGVFRENGKPFRESEVRRIISRIFTVPPDYRFSFYTESVENDGPGFFFLCLRCQKEINLWGYIGVADLNQRWQITGEPKIVCRKCGLVLSPAVVSALNAVSELYFLRDRDRFYDEAEQIRQAYAAFQMGMVDLISRLTVRQREAVLCRLGIWRSDPLTQDETAEHLARLEGGQKVSRNRVGQLESVGVHNLREIFRGSGFYGGLAAKVAHLEQDLARAARREKALLANIEELQAQILSVGLRIGEVKKSAGESGSEPTISVLTQWKLSVRSFNAVSRALRQHLRVVTGEGFDPPLSFLLSLSAQKLRETIGVGPGTIEELNAVLNSRGYFLREEKSEE